MRIGDAVVDLERSIRRLDGESVRFLARPRVVAVGRRVSGYHGVRGGEDCMRLGEFRVEFDGGLERLEPLGEPLAAEEDPVLQPVAALQIMFVGLQIVGWPPTGIRQFEADRFAECLPQRRDDVAGDLALDRENIGERLVVGLRPQVRIIRHLDQLGSDADLLPRLSHAPFEDVLDPELFRDLAHADGLVLECE